MQENLFLWKKSTMNAFPSEVKRKILILYELGVSIDEIEYLITMKFRKRIELNELINFLFYSI